MSIAFFAIFLGPLAFAQSAQVRITAPLSLHESTTTTTSRQVITGSSGQRQIDTVSDGHSDSVGLGTSEQSGSNTIMTGPTDVGVVEEQHVFYPGQTKPVLLSPAGQNTGSGSIQTGSQNNSYK